MFIQEEKDFTSVIEFMFPLDPELFDKWHILAGHGKEACILDTCSKLKDLGDALKFYVIKDGTGAVAFFGKHSFYLNTFFITPAYRKQGAEIFKLIRNNLPEFCLVALYEKNTRAIKFLERNGAVKLANIAHTEHNAVLLQLGKVQ